MRMGRQPLFFFCGLLADVFVAAAGGGAFCGAALLAFVALAALALFAALGESLLLGGGVGGVSGIQINLAARPPCRFAPK